MPVAPTYPGVYIEEVPSGVRTITGVSTSMTAFVGQALKGAVNTPTVIRSFSDYIREFGGLWEASSMSFSVQQYFANGGGEAIVVRMFEPANDILNRTARVEFGTELVLRAKSPGEWPNGLRVVVDHVTPDPANLLNLTTLPVDPNDNTPLETLRNLSLDNTSPAYIETVVNQRSAYWRVASLAPPVNDGEEAALGGDDGNALSYASLVPADESGGIFALNTVDIFNLLCLPPVPGTVLEYQGALATAADYCAKHRAMLIVDAHPDSTLTSVATERPSPGDGKKNAAFYFPWITALHPLKPGILEDFPPSGAIAGVFARTDVQRGVWKAPAGTDAVISAVQGLSIPLTDGENGSLNKEGINCLRTFPGVGSVVWGARTMDGADMNASEWKYVPVRRIALYIEESLFRGLKWVVFEPNSHPLWSQIRLNVGAFMNDLFRKGAFHGTSPKDAYFVKCDAETTTQTDINLGIVNILVGFAPLKPAEFVILKIQQMAGQVQV